MQQVGLRGCELFQVAVSVLLIQCEGKLWFIECVMDGSRFKLLLHRCSTVISVICVSVRINMQLWLQFTQVYLVWRVLTFANRKIYFIKDKVRMNAHLRYTLHWSMQHCYSYKIRLHLTDSRSGYALEVPVGMSTGTSAILTEVYREFPQFLQANSGIIHSWGYDRFLLNPFPLIIHQSP
jgi:hypothetical protein